MPHLRLRHLHLPHFHARHSDAKPVEGVLPGAAMRMHAVHAQLAAKESAEASVHHQAQVMRKRKNSVANQSVPPSDVILSCTADETDGDVPADADHQHATADRAGAEKNTDAHPLKRHDFFTIAIILICGLASIFVFAAYTPDMARHELHRVHMHSFGTSISSPMFALSASTPLQFGGHRHGILAEGTSHICLDLKMIISCLALDEDCQKATGHRRARRARRARRLSPGNVSADDDAALTYYFWEGHPSHNDSRVFKEEEVVLEEHENVELYVRCIEPAQHGVDADAQIYLQIATTEEQQFGLMVQLTETGVIGKWRVLLAGLLFIVIFGLVLSEIINRVYAALLGMVASLGLYMLIFEKPELHEVMGHVEWGTILLLFCTPSETGTRNLLIPRAADQEITSSHLAQV